MTYPNGDPLEGLDATPEERLAFYEALDEAEAEEAGLPGGDYDPDGPWHDFEAAAAQMDRNRALDAQRFGEDLAAQLDRGRPSAEDKLQRGLARVEQGTYLPPAWDPLQAAAGTCDGQRDAFGRCASRYHSADCMNVIEGSAAASDATAAHAWRDTLLHRTPDPELLGYELATPAGGEDLWSDLLAPPGGQDAAVREQMLAILGGEGRAEQPRPVMPSRQPLPPVASLRAELGL